jgi:hypothetical protein
MKNLLSTCTDRKRASFANLFSNVVILTLATIAFSGCQKDAIKTSVEDGQNVNKHSVSPEGDVVNDYGLSPQTTWELQQARAATARYRDIRNAIKDGYSNINVDVPNMGHHFMNTNLIDGTFDIRKPAILVYNGLDTGNPELVAVEYAVPLTDPLPEGFTGTADVWNGTSGFPFWLVHAWVWKFNPDGAFNWTNPDVDLD